MNIKKYIQREFGALIDKNHNKTLEQIMTDFWKEASKDMFIPQTLGGHGLMKIKVFLKNGIEHAFYYVGKKKHINLFNSTGYKITEFIKQSATTKSKKRVNDFLKNHENHTIYLEFRFWADEDSHKVICEECDKKILIAYTEEDEEWIEKIPQYDIAAMPNDLRHILHELVRKGINIDEFGRELERLIEKANNLSKL